MAILMLSCTGCQQKDEGPDGPTKSEWVVALYAQQGEKMDMTMKGAIDALDAVGDNVCKAMSTGGLDAYVQHKPVGGDGMTDYATRFRCPELRDAYVKAGGYTLDVARYGA